MYLSSFSCKDQLLLMKTMLSKYSTEFILKPVGNEKK